MKKLLSVFFIGSMLALTACGGDSDSSGDNNNSGARENDPHSNLAKPAEATVDGGECQVASDGTTWGVRGGSCTFTHARYGTEVVEMSCDDSGNIMLPDFNFEDGSYYRTIDGAAFVCP